MSTKNAFGSRASPDRRILSHPSHHLFCTRNGREYRKNKGLEGLEEYKGRDAWKKNGNALRIFLIPTFNHECCTQQWLQ